MIKLIKTGRDGWKDELDGLLERMRTTPGDVDSIVRNICEDIRTRGDEALYGYTEKFDRFDAHETGLEIPAETIASAPDRIDAGLLDAIRTAAERIEDFHARQKENSWITTDPDGTILGQKVTPVDRVGIYVPGGKNAFPSTVLMNAIPAMIAGVPEITVVSPTPGGEVSDVLLAAAHVAGVRRMFRIGGAQAVAALAYGTETVPGVDKVVGPGNMFVAHAKKILQGVIGIDAIAGPSEILVVADDGADPRLVAMDMLSQAEHDEAASAILVTPSMGLAEKVMAILEVEAETLPRKAVVSESLSNHGACIVTGTLDEAIEMANTIAPEHLELMLENAIEHLGKVRNAGAIFLGYHCPEAIGDYIAGPNHTLPTSSTSRFYSPLGVNDFVKRSSIIGFSKTATRNLGPKAVKIARAEELEAHARSVEYRLK